MIPYQAIYKSESYMRLYPATLTDARLIRRCYQKMAKRRIRISPVSTVRGKLFFAQGIGRHPI